MNAISKIKELKEDKGTTITLYLRKIELEAIDKIAEKEGVKRNKLIRIILADFTENYNKSKGE